MNTENIGARRLHSILEKILEEISYEGPDQETKKYQITQEYVKERLVDYAKKHDLKKYLL